MIPLRPYQERSVDALRRGLLERKRRQMLYAPTGAGKGHIATAIVQSSSERGRRVLVLSHRRELVEDLSGRFDKAGIEHGVILAGHWRYLPWLPVQIASVPTLARRDKPEADLVIVDEAHHATASTWKQILDAYPNAPIIGLSATPVRMDGRPLGELFESLVIAATPAELVEDGYLVPVTGFAYDAPDLHEVKKTAGDYNEQALGLVMSEKKLVGNIAEQYLKHARGPDGRLLKAIIFAVHVEHSRTLVERFRELGVAAEHVDGSMARRERDAVFQRYRAGATTVVSNVMIATEGFDLPDIACVILARPTLSVGLAIQMIGRGRRPVPCACGAIPHWRDATCKCGRPVVKRALRLHDHAGVVVQHGLPDDPREWSLDADASEGRRGKGGAAAVSVRTCKQCFAIYAPTLPACPQCGFVNPKRTTEIKEVEGEAVPLEKIRPRIVTSEENMKSHYLRLLKKAQAKGHKAGEAAYQFKWLYHRWPDRRWAESAPVADVATPGAEVSSHA